MQDIKDLLKAEIEKSNVYSKRNFGLITGDGFREMVEDLLKSKGFTMFLLTAYMTNIMGTSDLAEWAKNSGKLGSEITIDGLRDMIRDNIDTFRPLLEMLYWGINIGRKLERDEQDTLRQMEQGMRLDPADKAELDAILAEANSEHVCPICHKAIEDGDVCEMPGGPHALCDDPKLERHNRLSRSGPDGSRQTGYVDDSGTECWL